MSHEQETHTAGLLYFIPHWVFENEEISSSAKLVYALLSGLAHGNEKKECFPSDKYIGERLGMSREQANACVGQLAKAGAISKRDGAHPNAFRKRRYITVHLELKKCLRSEEKSTIDGGENFTPGGEEKFTHSNKEYRNKEKKPPTEAKSARKSRAPHVSTSSEDHEKLVKDFGEETVQRAYEKLSEWKSDTPKSKWKKNDHLAIKRWVIDALKEEDHKAQKASKSDEKRIKEVQLWLRTGPFTIDLQNAFKTGKLKPKETHIEFYGRDPVKIKYLDPKAEELIEHHLKKLNL